MGKRFYIYFLCVLLAFVAIVFSACGGSDNSASGDNGGENLGSQVGNIIGNITGSSKGTIKDDPNAPVRDDTPRVLANSADGALTIDGNGATIDYSNASDGYIMAKYEGDNTRIKLQITKDGGSTYTYDVAPGTDFAAFPLTDGSGNYNVAMFLNIEGDKYSQACAGTVQSDITDEFSPFLRPNQYCNFTDATQAVAKSAEVAQGAKSDLKVIESVFLFVTSNVVYDYDKAANVQSGYIPDVDETLSTGKGICFDYASLTSCMLRSQGIPCKLVVGYAGDAYHAWISVYVDGTGWVANMIQFDADKWTLMDPTFAASGDRADPNLVGNGQNYNPVYFY